MTRWEEIRALPGFERQAELVLATLIARAAARADDAESYLAWAETKKQYPARFRPDPDGTTVEVIWPGLNSIVVTLGSFVPGAEVVSGDLGDLADVPETEEEEDP